MTTTTLATEVTRVRGHFDGALALIDARDTRTLDPAARLTRQLLRQALVEYQAGGLFPLNHDLGAGLRPTFVDGRGTRCAMAHLMELGGAGELVAEVAAQSNHAYVEELATDPRFQAWLESAGLTVDEAARIQPGYGCVPAADCLCTIATPAGGAARAVVEATVTSQVPMENKLTVNVDVVHGETTVKVGDAVEAKRTLATQVGDRVLVSLHQVEGQFEVLVIVPPSGVFGSGPLIANICGATVPNDPFPSQSRRSKIGPLTTTELLAFRTGSQAACASALEARDHCFSVCPEANIDSCVYAQPEAGAPIADAGAPIADSGTNTNTSSSGRVITTPSGDAGALGTSGTTATPSSTDDEGGCSTTGSSAPASVAVLLAVVGAMMARRRLAQ